MSASGSKVRAEGSVSRRALLGTGLGHGIALAVLAGAGGAFAPKAALAAAPSSGRPGSLPRVAALVVFSIFYTLRYSVKYE